jgi:hypothetical protein
MEGLRVKRRTVKAMVMRKTRRRTSEPALRRFVPREISS